MDRPDDRRPDGSSDDGPLRERGDTVSEGRDEAAASRGLNDRGDDVYARNEAATRRDIAREEFGGVDVPATLVGALVAIAATLLLGGIAGAILGTRVFRDPSLRNTDVLIAAVVGAIVLCIAYFVGGWVAGRMARYNGVPNGLLAALWTVLVFAVSTALGATLGQRYEIFAGASVPNFIPGEDALTGGIIGAVVAIVLMLLFAALGGRRGEAYHERADAVLTEPRVRRA